MTVGQSVVSHRADVVPMKRRGWWRWRCTAGDTWCQTNSEDVATRTARAHEEMVGIDPAADAEAQAYTADGTGLL